MVDERDGLLVGDLPVGEEDLDRAQGEAGCVRLGPGLEVFGLRCRLVARRDGSGRTIGEGGCDAEPGAGVVMAEGVAAVRPAFVVLLAVGVEPVAAVVFAVIAESGVGWRPAYRPSEYSP